MQATPNGGRSIVLMVGDTVAEQLVMFDLVELTCPWISKQLSICHGSSRIECQDWPWLAALQRGSQHTTGADQWYYSKDLKRNSYTNKRANYGIHVIMIWLLLAITS